MLGGARLDRRAQGAERIDIVVKLLFVSSVTLRIASFNGRPGKSRGAVVDLVVDVGDVANIGDVIGAIEVPQEAEQHVEHDHRRALPIWAKS